MSNRISSQIMRATYHRLYFEYSLKRYSVLQCTSWHTESEHNNVIGPNKLLFTCIPHFKDYVTPVKPLTVLSVRLLVTFAISFWNFKDFKTWFVIERTSIFILIVFENYVIFRLRLRLPVIWMRKHCVYGDILVSETVYCLFTFNWTRYMLQRLHRCGLWV